MANESFSFEEALGPPSGASENKPGNSFSFEEALGQPSQAAPGFIPTVKRTGGQMLTTAATSLEDVTGPNAVTRAVHDTGQGIIDRNPAGIRSLRDLVDSPWLAVKESVGQFAPQIAAAAAGGAAGARLGALAGPAGAAVGGAVGSLVPIFTQEYGGIRQEQKESGQEDKGRALAAAGAASALERVGMSKALNVLKGVPGGSAASILKEAGKGVLKEGVTEGAQNVIEQWGAFKDPTTGENLEDTALSAAMGGIGGGVMGGASGAVDRIRQPRQQTLDSAPPQMQEPQAAIPATVDEATPAIDPNEGPLSKAAAMAGGLGLADAASAPAAPDAHAVLLEAMPRMSDEQHRLARMVQADLERADLPAGVRAMREAEARELAGAAGPSGFQPDEMARERFSESVAEQPVDSGALGQMQDQVQPQANEPGWAEESAVDGQGQAAGIALGKIDDSGARIAKLDAEAAAADAKAADWASRTYKPNAKELPDHAAKGGPADVGEANEQRRLKVIAAAKQEAAAARAQAEELRERGNSEAALASKVHGDRQTFMDTPETAEMQASSADVGSRPKNWRTNMFAAVKVAKSLGIDHKGKRLAQVMAEIDAADAQHAGGTSVEQGLTGGASAIHDAGSQAAQPTTPHAPAGNPTREQSAQRIAAAGQQWASMPAAERAALVGRVAGIKPVLAKNMPKAQWENLNGDIQKKLADAMAPAEASVKQTESPENPMGTIANYASSATKTVAEAEGNPATDQAPINQAGGAVGDEQAFAAETGTLGIPRADMPQVPTANHGGLVKHLNAQGIAHETTSVDAASLKPTQAEYSPSKVEAAKGASGDRAVIVSKDGHIIDGHHQAVAAAEEGKQVKAIVLDAPVEQALEAVKASPSAAAPSAENATETIAKSADPASGDGQSSPKSVGTQQHPQSAAPGPSTDADQNPAPAQTQQEQDAAKNVANPGDASTRSTRGAPPRSTTKIEDFGEELQGARKMLYAEAYADGMTKAKELDTKAHPLSKTWPEPDYAKLLEGGTPLPAVSMARALREAVATKPQSAWKLNGWSSKMETLRSFAEDVVAGQIEVDAVARAMDRAAIAGVAHKAALYEAMGHGQSLKGIDVSAGHYSMYDGVRYDPARTIWTVSREAKASAFGNWPRDLAKGDTREEAIAAFKKRASELLAEEQAPAKGATFEIYSKRAGGAREFFIGKKIGIKVAELKAGFPDLKAAREYKAAHQTELEELLAKYKAIPPVRGERNAPRIGEDMRQGADVTPEWFQEAFGFRGVQFGNYVEGGRRQQDLNQAYDALMDLAGVLSLPPRALSLGGRLGLAFGARGKGGTDPAAAHYEPGSVVINLTKREGAGSLAHEWWHALDNYFSRESGDGSSYMTADSTRGDGVREEMRAAFREVNAAINRTRMLERSRKLDDRRTKEYWSTKPEISARAFESYIIAKLQDQNAGNDYLANVVSDAMFALEGAYPYPTAGEMAQIRGGFDAFFQTVETREEGGATVLYSTSDAAPPANPLPLENVEQLVQQALAGLRNPPPIKTVRSPADIGLVVPPTDRVFGYTVRGGDIYVFQSGMGSDLDVFETVFHELFHAGVHNVLDGQDYVQAMLDLAKRDGRVQEYANNWKKDAPEAAQQLQALRQRGYSGSELIAQYEALAIEEGLAVVAEELRAQKQAGTKLGMRVRVLANWLAVVAERMGMQRLADSIRKMTYNEAERFVLKAIEHAGNVSGPLAAGPDTLARYRTSGSNPVAQRMGDAIKGMTVSNLKQQAGFKAADYRGLGLQLLGRRQLVDVYGSMLPELRAYSDLMARMDADKNEAGAGADQLAQDWSKLSDEHQLAELMHDATLAQMDPAQDYVSGDNRLKYGELRRRFEALSPAAREVYARARDTYKQHMRDVRSAIKERIERAEMSSERRAAMLKRLDDEFFGQTKGVYFPLARFGQYVVVVKGVDGKTASVSRAETMGEADALRTEMLAAFPQAKGFTVGKVLKAKDFVAERDSVGRGFMEQLYGVLDKQGMDAKQRAELEDALGQLYLSSLPDLSWAKHGIHRKGTAGFSQDARRAFAQNVFHGASYLAKLRYGDQLQDELAEMQKRVDAGSTNADFDSVKAQQVVDEMVKRHDAAMNPKSNALSTALTSLGFMFHLGLSPASAMVNLSQTALVAYPIMGAKWGFGKSSAALLKASQEAVRGKNDITASLNPDEKAAYEEAVRAGVVDVTMAHDLAGIAQGEDRNVSHKLAPVMRAASWMFHHAEKFNRQITFVAAYRLARETGVDHKQAYQQAVQATYDGHFDYSANNRPRFMQGNVARVLLLFKQYSQNMVYTMARSAQQSLKGATPEARAEARKALGGLLTMHAMAAGALGLPMVTTLLSVASMLGGDDDEPWDAQVALQNLLADTFGQKPAEVLAHGLSRLTPWDISGRVGLDKLIFPDVQEGLEGQRLGESAMTAALGPVAAIGINALKGLQEMSEGRYARGLETMAPTVLRGPLKAWRYETEGVKDKTGIVVQDEVDAAALLGQAAGFSPSGVRNAYEGKAAIVGHDRALQARRSALVEQFAMAAMAKDEEGKAEAREAIARFNDKNPNRRIQPLQLVQSVHQREKRIREAKEGVYLPTKRRDVLEQGRFAAAD